MRIEELRRRKKALGYTNRMIADRSGVPLGTVQKIFGGATTSPRYETMAALEAVLYGAERDSAGEYTLEDYYAMPEDRRVELIDGVIYDMTAPTSVNQFLASMVFNRMMNFQEAHPGDCMPFLAPIDVQLDCDDRTMIQPDLIVLGGKDQNHIRKIYGAPDFVMEVLSPSTRRRDLIIKLNKYMNAGVREYWIVDPEKETVTVFDFEHDIFPVYYTFGDRIPVSISGGSLIIDFAEIAERFHAYFGDWKETLRRQEPAE